MPISSLPRCALVLCLAAALAGCGGSQTPGIGSPGAVLQKLAPPTRSDSSARAPTGFLYATWPNGEQGQWVQEFAIVGGGALKLIRNTDTGGGPDGVAVDPAANFLYVADNATVSGFSIDVHTGVLTPVPGSPFAGGSCTYCGVAVDPHGKFVYVSCLSGIYAYTINRSTGALTLVSGSPFGVKQQLGVAANPKIEHVYAVTGTGSGSTGQDGVIWDYTINEATGALTLFGSSETEGAGSNDVAVDASGTFVLVTNPGSNTVTTFEVDASLDYLLLTEVAAAGNYPYSAAVDPKAKFVYAANLGGNDISAYSILPNAEVGSVMGSPFATGAYGPFHLAIDREGRFLYASLSQYTSGGGGIFGLAIDAAGALTPISGSPFESQASLNGVATCRVIGNRCKPPPL